MNTLCRLVPAVVITLLMATACQSSDDTRSAGLDEPALAAGTEASAGEAGADDGVETPPASTDDAESSSVSPLAYADLSLPPAMGIEELAAAAATEEPVPTTISIERLGLDDTTVLAVGVEPNGEMTVPPPLDVGWYRFGPTPGEAGSAVLAGHIASDGIPGAFRYLDRLEAGDLVTVGFDDGSSQTFAVDAQLQVDKTELPFDIMFARSGPPKLALITCGGEFDYDARSYTDNVVVTASPVAG